MAAKYRRLKLACYATNLCMSVSGNLSPLLFITFRTLYGISFTQMGLLVLINFVTQLTVDLIFSFFSHRFNIPKMTKATPVLTATGLLVYALWPFVFPNAVYTGLVISTMIFSAASGFGEVLINPVITSIPADDPDRELSKLHSVYAWGIVGMIVVGTLFLLAFGSANWQWLPLLLMLVPIATIILYHGCEIPDSETPERVSGALQLLRHRSLWLCVAAIFLGGASECTMSQWCSGFLEQALNIPKVWGDLFGVAMFSVMLGMGRSLYGKFGKNAVRVLVLGSAGAVCCYLTAALSGSAVIGLLACALTGLCTSMLWPGSLVAASEHFPTGGVFFFAMMASGGDLGASVGPQLVGMITDAVIAAPGMVETAASMGLSPEQFGMKLGMLAGALFPLMAIPVYLRLGRKKPT